MPADKLLSQMIPTLLLTLEATVIVTTIDLSSTVVLMPRLAMLVILHFQMAIPGAATMMTLESLDTVAVTAMLVAFTWKFSTIVRLAAIHTDMVHTDMFVILQM